MKIGFIGCVESSQIALEALLLSGSGTVASKDVSAGTQNITLGTIKIN